MFIKNVIRYNKEVLNMITEQQAKEINKRAYAGTTEAVQSLQRIEAKKRKTEQQEAILKDIAINYY